MQKEPHSDCRGGVSLAVAAVVVSMILVACFPLDESTASPTLRAGLRSSSYGISPFPPPDWWLDSSRSMAARFDGEPAPAVVWIVGIVAHGGYCWLNFPAPSSGQDYPKIVFTGIEGNEDYLDLFDWQGVKVWLQVEPADADVSTLIDLVLGRYASHSSVIGFGIDDEWYRNREYQDGKAVTDAEAQAWVAQVRSYNPHYLFFAKHWLSERMPPTCRDGMMFLDDSQKFQSLEGMVAEFEEWGRHFAPAPVGFQYGYPADRTWWGTLADPPRDIGRALLAKIPNTTDLYWVDFTADEIWPPAE
jgi:hypothetical protein